MYVEESPAVSHLVVVMVGGGNYQPCPFCWRLGSWSHRQGGLWNCLPRGFHGYRLMQAAH